MKLDNTPKLRALTTDEVNKIAGGQKIDTTGRNDRALALVKASEAWMASVGIDSH